MRNNEPFQDMNLPLHIISVCPLKTKESVLYFFLPCQRNAHALPAQLSATHNKYRVYTSLVSSAWCRSKLFKNLV